MDSTQPVRQAPGGALLSHEKPPRGQSPVDVPHRLEASAGQRWQEAASQSPVQSGYAAVLSRSSGPWTLHHKVSSGQRGFAGEGAAQGRFPVPAEHRKDCGASPGSVLLGGGGRGEGDRLSVRSAGRYAPKSTCRTRPPYIPRGIGGQSAARTATGPIRLPRGSPRSRPVRRVQAAAPACRATPRSPCADSGLGQIGCLEGGPGP